MRPRPVEDRFWEKVAIPANVATECWEWTATKKRNGYGQIMVSHGVPKKAHRWSYEFFNGEIPSDGPGFHGWCVCHACDNPGCVNPAHLFLGSQQDNMYDRDSKGRAAPVQGEQNANCVLSEADVRAIHSSRASAPRAATQYGVHVVTVRAIRDGVAWSHLGLGVATSAPRGKQPGSHFPASFRKALASEPGSARAVGEKFGVCQNTVFRARKDFLE